VPAPSLLTDSIVSRCRALGFALAGVCEAKASDRAAEYRAWIDAGRHGEMAYLARNIEARLDPRVLVPGARSIICVADRYAAAAPGHSPSLPGRGAAGGSAVHQQSTARDDIATTPTPPPPLSEREGQKSAEGKRSAVGRIARYAQGDDYHIVMKRRLHALCDELRAAHPGHVFRACVDTAPVLEREHAQRAGLGAIGKHTLLIERGAGSYLLLGEIITTLDLSPSPAAEPDPCGSCTRCIDACPTGAIAPWTVNATRCISYLTIEHRTAIAAEFHRPIGEWLFGCDICQEVCPHNQPKRSNADAAVHAAYAPRRDGFDAREVMNWTEDDRRRAFASSAMKRAKLDMMKRNAAIVLANQRPAPADISSTSGH
jgi:epoxyqueuosine reductase